MAEMTPPRMPRAPRIEMTAANAGAQHHQHADQADADGDPAARADVLGRYRNRWWTTLGGVASAVFLIALNGMLLWLVLGGAPPGG